MAEAQEYSVRPTAPQATEQYSDISLTGLFTAHTALINSERQAIWQRYNVMLIANAVIFGFLAGGVRTAMEVGFGMSFGLLLCAIWWVITREGWVLIGMQTDRADQFVWTALDRDANPFRIALAYESGVRGGRIYNMAKMVIYLFATGYLFIGVSRLF
ncbi:MAG: hypothetical protein Q8R39_01910 [bacterium]|nr:hypothetical protein [bacterium]